MENNYYLLGIESLKVDGKRLEAAQILQAFFDKKIWLFQEATPSVAALRAGDQFAVYGSIAARPYLLGSFTLSEMPVQLRGGYLDLPEGLKEHFSLSAGITETRCWENPKPLGRLAPNLAVLLEGHWGEPFLSLGVRQIAKSDFERIMHGGLKSDGLVHDVSALQGGEFAEFDAERSEAALTGILEVIGWFGELATVKLSEQQTALEKAASQLQRIPLLQARLAALQDAVHTEQRLSQELRRKNDNLNNQINQLAQELKQEQQKRSRTEKVYSKMLHGFQREKAELLERVEAQRAELEQLRDSLGEINIVKRALQRIMSLLSADKREIG